MTAIPRYVSTVPEAAARIAGYIFGDGNPDVQYNPLGGPAFTFINKDTTFVNEWVRCAGVAGWSEGVQWAFASNGNPKVLRTALYAALGITDQNHNLYHSALKPTATFTPTRVEVEAFMASIVEVEGSFSTNPPKWFDEGRGVTYEDRIDNLVLTMRTQMASAVRSGIAAKTSLADCDSFPMPLITAARYPGDTPADWPDGAPPPPDETAPAIPTGLTAVPGNGQVGLTWTVNNEPDLFGYILYRDNTEIYIGPVPSFLDTGLVNGQSYAYQVASYDVSENASALSSAIVAIPVAPPDGADTTPPATPTNFAGAASSTSITLSWTGSTSPDVASYRVYRGSSLLATVVAPTNAYADTGLVPDTDYTYRLTAVDTSGNESPSTAFIGVHTLDAPVSPPFITTEYIKIVDRVGCPGAIDVFVAHRSGAPLLAKLEAVTGGRWERVMDDISSAEIQMDMANLPADCVSIVQGLTRWAYEIVIFRDGVRVWTGPVQDVLPQGQNLTITAKDKMAWTTVRVISSNLSYPEPGEEAATVFNDLVNNAMSADSVPGLVATATPTGLRVVRDYTFNPPQYAWEAIEELARTAVDFTMIGPTMVAGSFVVPTSPVSVLTSQAFAQLPSSPLLASNVATQWYVTGDPDQDLLASYGGIDPVIGLVQRIAQEDDILDQESLDQNAKTRWELTSSPLIGESSFVLAAEAPWPVELIVPGCVVDVRFYETLFPIVGRHRLKRASFTWSAGGDGPAETVEVTLEPVGTELIS